MVNAVVESVCEERPEATAAPTGRFRRHSVQSGHHEERGVQTPAERRGRGAEEAEDGRRCVESDAKMVQSAGAEPERQRGAQEQRGRRSERRGRFTRG